MDEQLPAWLTRQLDAGGQHGKLVTKEWSQSGDFEHVTMLWLGALGEYARQEVVYLTPDDVVIFDVLYPIADDEIHRYLHEWPRASTPRKDVSGSGMQLA